MGRIEKIRKFNKKWLNEDWAKGWLCEDTDGTSFQEAYCKICRSHIRAHQTDLIRHTKSVKHISRIKAINTKSVNKITSHVKVSNDDDKKKDICLAVHVAVHSSLRSIDHLGELLNTLNISSIKQHRTKCSAIIKKVVAPSLLAALLEDISGRPFSLIIDESTDISVKKFFCVCVRYFSLKKNDIVVDFLGMFEVEKTTSMQLYTELKNFLINLNLDLNCLVGLGTDGAANLCGKNNSVFTLFKADHPKLQLIRCICHSLDNAASKAAESLPSNLDFLCKEIYNWFNCSPLRRIEYKRLFDLLNMGDDEKRFHNFVQLSGTRWLCRYQVLNVISEHFFELKTHFHSVVNKEKCFTARMLKEMLDDERNYLYILVTKSVLFEINKVNLLFQKNYVEIGKAYTDLENIILFLGKKVMKPLFTTNINVIMKNVDNPLAFFKPQQGNVGEIDLGIDYYRAVTKCSLDKCAISEVESRCLGYITALLKECVKRLPDNLYHFKKLQQFSPEIILNPTNVTKFCDLPFTDVFIEEKNLFKVENQYNILKNINWKDMYGPEVFNNSYKFWATVLNHKNAGGDLVFSELAEFVLLLLTFPNSNATVERTFSVMNLTKTKLRNRMNLSMLSAIIRLKIFLYINQICCNKFRPTKEMFEKFNTKMMYLSETLETEDTEAFNEMIEQTDTDYPVLCIPNELQ